MSYQLNNDISAYQPSSISYLDSLYNHGSRGLIVKLTEGNWYLNQSAGNQIYNGLKVFKNVAVYHYLDGYSSAVAQAEYFVSWMKAFHLDSTTIWALDVEDPSLPSDCGNMINEFNNYVSKHGYPAGNIVYGSASWFLEGRIPTSRINTNKYWVAAYGASDPGFDGVGMWQYTDDFCGLNTDGSYDFYGYLDPKPSKKAQPKPKHETVKKTEHHVTKPSPKPVVKHPVKLTDSYYKKPGWYRVIKDYVNIYDDLHLKDPLNIQLSFGTRFKANSVAYDGSCPRLVTQNGIVTANTKYVKPLN